VTALHEGDTPRTPGPVPLRAGRNEFRLGATYGADGGAQP
jgi:hypothetical protein